MASLAAFVLACLVLVAASGPHLICILTRSARGGRWAGSVSALGVETGTLLHIIAAACGLATLIADRSFALAALRCAGAGHRVSPCTPCTTQSPAGGHPRLRFTTDRGDAEYTVA